MAKINASLNTSRKLFSLLAGNNINGEGSVIVIKSHIPVANGKISSKLSTIPSKSTANVAIYEGLTMLLNAFMKEGISEPVSIVTSNRASAQAHDLRSKLTNGFSLEEAIEEILGYENAEGELIIADEQEQESVATFLASYSQVLDSDKLDVNLIGKSELLDWAVKPAGKNTAKPKSGDKIVVENHKVVGGKYQFTEWSGREVADQYIRDGEYRVRYAGTKAYVLKLWNDQDERGVFVGDDGQEHPARQSMHKRHTRVARHLLFDVINALPSEPNDLEAEVVEEATSACGLF